MRWNKTWFSYLVWVFYTVLVCVSLAMSTVAVCFSLSLSNQYLILALICVSFTITAGVYLAGRLVIPHVHARLMKDAHGKKMLEWFLALSLFSAAVLYRIYALLHPAAGMSSDTGFYEMAVIRAQGGVPAMAHGASYLYTCVLSFLLSFLGNKPMAGVVFQFALQTAMLPLLYFAVKGLCGRIPAMAALAAAGLFPLFPGKLANLTPEVFYTFLVCAGLFATSLYCKGLSKGTFGRGGRLVFPLLLGLMAGLLLYLDVYGAAFVLFVLSVLFLEGSADNRSYAAQDSRKPGRAAARGITQLLPAAIGAAAALSGLLTVDGMGNIGEGLRLWLSSYALRPTAAFLRYQSPLGGYLALSAFAALAVPGFWHARRQKSSPWMLFLLITVVAFPALGIGALDQGPLTLCLWAVCAGLGIQNLADGADRTVQAGKPEMSEAEILEPGQTNELAEDLTIVELDAPEPMDPKEPAPTPYETAAEIMEHPEPAVNSGIVEPKEIKYIENPLPVPKKHVKKEMDYLFDVPEEELHFDIEVNQEDDFDY